MILTQVEMVAHSWHCIDADALHVAYYILNDLI